MIDPVILSILAFILYYFLINSNVKKYPANIVMPVLLIVLFTPGLLLTIPPGPGGVFISGESSLTSVSIHASVVGLLFFGLLKFFPQYY